jgi:DNA-directed RNA polymerase subunit RPC12/RpoP
MSTTTDIMKCSRCGREITVTEPGATGWEALGDGREVTCEACMCQICAAARAQGEAVRHRRIAHGVYNARLYIKEFGLSAFLRTRGRRP